MAYKEIHAPSAGPYDKNITQLVCSFIREKCQGLLCQPENGAEGDCDGFAGCSYNHDREVDRLCLEKAIERFMASGTKEDAFDIYYCYTQMFHPFGSDYHAADILIRTLADHEQNSGILLKKHRDHFSHSVYVFVLGIAIYCANEGYRRIFSQYYGLDGEWGAHSEFLRLWGMTALFHDVGYPFEIVFEQIKDYAGGLEDVLRTVGSAAAPSVGYRRMDDFSSLSAGDVEKVAPYLTASSRLNVYSILAGDLSKKFGLRFEDAYELLRNRADGTEAFMDHAYFSAIILLKRRLSALQEGEILPACELDCITAILLHNSLFKFEIFSGMPMSMTVHPLAYLLMLCDELQCWNRTAFGQNTRREMSAWDADLLTSREGIAMQYCFEDWDQKKAVEMREGHFVKSISRLLCTDELGGLTVTVKECKKTTHTSPILSSGSFLSLYDLAKATNACYDSFCQEHAADGLYDEEIAGSMERSFARLPLEYQLSNIALAKSYAVKLDAIGCFYSEKPMDREIVRTFTPEELDCISRLEHLRWSEEKLGMGWVYGRSYLEFEGKERRHMREKCREHCDLIPYDELTDIEQEKDQIHMQAMIDLLYNYGNGLRIYRL